jgi:hypothetical protein
VTKFVVYRNPYRGTGQAPFEVRDALIDGATIDRCLTRREAESVTHALNTKSGKQTVEDACIGWDGSSFPAVGQCGWRIRREHAR